MSDAPTDVDGNYQFDLLVAGEYELLARRRGYEDVHRTNITVSSDSVTVVEVTLPFSFRKVVGETAEPGGPASSPGTRTPVPPTTASGR